MTARKRTPAKKPTAPKEVEAVVVRSSIFKQASLPEWFMLAVLVCILGIYGYNSWPSGGGTEPKPAPTPVVPVPNEYNIGKIAYSEAPTDATMAKQIAGWYKSGAAKLYGDGGLSDIESVTKEINKQFAAKQCKDDATCQKWDAWKAAVSKASIDEQKRRGTFTRQDWFSVLTEVATALEAVK